MIAEFPKKKKKNWKWLLPGWGKKTHTHKRNIATAKKKKMVEQKRTLNSGRPSEKQALKNVTFLPI